ncbi:hypothetical protein COLO4_27205 [Corchorus olitorius]|uniref:Reverse transcriptase n=1 Tax=Corchorus olitorius TaxID=93759 RepID=A0A1R3HS50_9ROSI|nr:hypothetical protein COLO4_27205 [Corchorus olitorius]
MTIGTSEIGFLGMHLKEGKYVAQPHIGQALQDFPDENLTKKQIQQFLGIVNYMSDFLPNLAKISNPLRIMLKENPPQWSQKQTTAQMLDVKKKTVPNPQLLRWSQWFTRYSFTTRHIKGKHNLIPDMLSRPPKPPKESLQVLPLIASIINFILGRPPPKKKKDKNKDRQALKTNPFGDRPAQLPPLESPTYPDLAFPPELIELLTTGKLDTRAYHQMLKYQSLILRSFGETAISPLGVNPVYPPCSYRTGHIEYFPHAQIHDHYPSSISRSPSNFPQDYKELQKKLCEINATIPTSVMETFEFDAKEHYPEDYKAKINIDRMMFTEKFTRPFNRPLSVDAKDNLLKAVAVTWNPLWESPAITDDLPPPEDPIPYWEDTECPISLGNNNDLISHLLMSSDDLLN